MIQPKHLRIGNLIRWKYGEDDYNTIRAVSEEDVTIDTITLDYVDYEDIEGVILTAELLERMGFKIVNHIHGFTFWYNKRLKIEVYLDDLIVKYFGYSLPQKIEFLHQLQNFVHAISGEELTLEQKTPEGCKRIFNLHTDRCLKCGVKNGKPCELTLKEPIKSK